MQRAGIRSDSDQADTAAELAVKEPRCASGAEGSQGCVIFSAAARMVMAICCSLVAASSGEP